MDKIKRIKFILIVIAVIIALASLVFSHLLVRDLSVEEKNKMEVWAEAMKTFNNADEKTDLTLVLKVLNENNTIPVIVVDEKGKLQICRNISIPKSNSERFLQNRIQLYNHKNHKIRIYLKSVSRFKDVKDDYVDIFYDESLMLKRLAVYPYIQLGVVSVFVIIAILALLSLKRSEQNKVWVGLSKETAHQLGTPISSLMAWIEILHSRYPQDELIPELSYDVARLQLVADRFSKIGSMPELNLCELNKTLDDVINYLEKRASEKISFKRDYTNEPILVELNPSLFEWVIENLCKNAIDSMSGQGIISVSILSNGNKISIDVSDTGKGITKSRFKTVFEPGYTTKKRGWGLGLSLAKRIIEQYHKGKIYVKHSELNKGTTFRIELKK